MNRFIYPNAINYVTRRLSAPAMLGQLAEEAAELGKAALKLQHIQMGENPTPVTEPEAVEALVEEIADIYCTLDAIINKLEITYSEKVMPIIFEKGTRWADRVFEKYDEPARTEGKPEGGGANG